MSRINSASHDSSSEAGLAAVNLARGAVLPEQWTLPQEWNIEKREMFGNWKIDVQNQIKYLNRQLGHSMKYYPPSEQCTTATSISEKEEDEDLTRKLQVGRLETGLKRC